MLSGRSLRRTQTNFSIEKDVHANDQDAAKATASVSSSVCPVLIIASAPFATTTSHVWQIIQQKRCKRREFRVKLRYLKLLRRVRLEKTTKRVAAKQRLVHLPSTRSLMLKATARSVQDEEFTQIRRRLARPLGANFRLRTWLQGCLEVRKSKDKRAWTYRLLRNTAARSNATVNEQLYYIVIYNNQYDSNCTYILI